MLKISFIITKNDFKQLMLHIIITVIFLASIPIFLSASYLNANEILYLAEHYICLVGIILLTPVFLSENNKYIQELLLSKKMPLTLIWLKRILLQIILLSILILICLKVLQLNHCIFSFFRVYYVVSANAIFLGGLGVLTYSIFNNWIFGYMLPLFYYMLSLFFKNNSIVKTFNLFSMQYHSLDKKHFLLIAGIGCIIISLVFLEKTKRLMRD